MHSVFAAASQWNNFYTSASYKEQPHIFSFIDTVNVIVSFCYIPVCLAAPVRVHVRMNINSLNGDKCLFSTFSCRVQRKIWEGGTIMKCEHLWRRALHSCAALKVSSSSSVLYLSVMGLPFAGLPCMQNIRSPPLGTNNAFG